ncbi:hypothetical protein BD324DRAFT_662555 [Kockovaella imperatae]|uniref:Uncharacterized protein n=1 Tax=Kockovaella imperatae TaxID=4999 RepID=A0A1Y1UAX2_9TREE|nr:hypothetical protein BD324DRAFT_662555 [Kockovaella imperatae]ORX35152.1 hypothetical protein BD324DRAFT_662555 [Kockovaella imperatae]
MQSMTSSLLHNSSLGNSSIWRWTPRADTDEPWHTLLAVASGATLGALTARAFNSIVSWSPSWHGTRASKESTAPSSSRREFTSPQIKGQAYVQNDPHEGNTNTSIVGGGSHSRLESTFDTTGSDGQRKATLAKTSDAGERVSEPDIALSTEERGTSRKLQADQSTSNPPLIDAIVPKRRSPFIEDPCKTPARRMTWIRLPCASPSSLELCHIECPVLLSRQSWDPVALAVGATAVYYGLSKASEWCETLMRPRFGNDYTNWSNTRYEGNTQTDELRRHNKSRVYARDYDSASSTDSWDRNGRRKDHFGTTDPLTAQDDTGPRSGSRRRSALMTTRNDRWFAGQDEGAHERTTEDLSDGKHVAFSFETKSGNLTAGDDKQSHQGLETRELNTTLDEPTLQKIVPTQLSIGKDDEVIPSPEDGRQSQENETRLAGGGYGELGISQIGPSSGYVSEADTASGPNDTVNDHRKLETQKEDLCPAADEQVHDATDPSSIRSVTTNG